MKNCDYSKKPLRFCPDQKFLDCEIFCLRSSKKDRENRSFFILHLGLELLKLSKPYFQKEGFTLYQGDCVKLMKQLEAESVDMIFADPPYNLSNGGYTVHAGKRVSVHKGDWDKSSGVEIDFKFHQSWIKASHRLLKLNGTIWSSGTYHSIYQCGFALQKGGWHILNEISWFKPNAAPNLSCRVFIASHETLIWARKSKSACQFF